MLYILHISKIYDKPMHTYIYMHTMPSFPQRAGCSTLVSTTLALEHTLFMCHSANIRWMPAEIVNEEMTRPRSHMASGTGGTTSQVLPRPAALDQDQTRLSRAAPPAPGRARRLRPQRPGSEKQGSGQGTNGQTRSSSRPIEGQAALNVTLRGGQPEHALREGAWSQPSGSDAIRGRSSAVAAARGLGSRWAPRAPRPPL